MGASTKEEVQKACEVFISPSEKPMLMEVFTKEDDETLAMVSFIKANTYTTVEGKLKQVISNVLGEEGVKILKKVMNR